MRSNIAVSACVLAAGLTACSKEETKPVDAVGPRVSVQVSPLRLAGISDVGYGITVKANDGTIVWQKSGLLSSTFGDGQGALAYVGPCDASNGANPNTVELVVESVTDSDGNPADYQNPAPAGRPLVKQVDCLPNKDAPVRFDLTILRSASQGFVDAGVNFSDIYCSAKFDCQDENNDPLELLFHDGKRDVSTVLGFACTTGDGTPTYLHISNVHIECNDPEGAEPQPVVREVAPLGEGNLGPAWPFFWMTASYRGKEKLEPYDKCYWNMAFGVNEGDDTKNCRLRVTGTASEDSWHGSGGMSPEGSIYPFIQWDIPLTDTDGNIMCGRDSVNALGSHVTTEYTDFGGGKFTNEWKCGSDITTTEKVSCDASIQGMTQEANFIQTPQGVAVAFGAEPPSQLFQLPSEYGEVDGCCFNPCCTDDVPTPPDD